MTYVIWKGLHGVAAQEFANARLAHEGYRDLDRRGAKYLQVIGPDGSEIDVDALAALAAAEESRS